MSDVASPVDPSIERLVGFTNGVVAIAITLIALPLVDIARSVESRPAADFLSANVLNLAAAALSFVVIAAFWKDHHRLYRSVTGSTTALINANLVWLATIVFLPVPTVLIVDSPGHDPVAAGVYVATVLVAETSIRVQKVILERKGLLGPGIAASTVFVWADWILVLLTLVALIVTVLFPVTSLYPLVLIVLARPIKWLALRGAP
ncbi:TMEM175 family protein [Lacisediminihabitans sp.]|uniref:TMEM175 family protein n=1 Tax=Lacisediminihabitans sp. TaxID=2787631 RepID=UPI00374CF3AC